MPQNVTLSFKNRLIDFGSVAGKLPIVQVVLEGFDSSLSDKQVVLSPEQLLQVIMYLDFNSTMWSLGGTVAEFNPSTYNSYVYPFEYRNGRVAIYAYRSTGSGLTAVRLELRVYSDAQSANIAYSQKVDSNRNKSRLRPLVIYTDSAGLLLNTANDAFADCQVAPTTDLYNSIPNVQGIPVMAPLVTEPYYSVGLYYPSNSYTIDFTPTNINIDDISEEKKDNADPYENGGTSGIGGGTGDFDGTGDDIQIPGLPTLSAVDTGMISLFAPSVQDLHNLANYLWGSLDITNWNRILTDPLQAVLGLSIVPVSAAKGTAKSVWVGNINTGVTMTQYATQYAEVDCGTLNVNEYWGAYLDYDPYTKAELYLPYIGARPIAVDDIMGKAVHVVYHVDILSGACVAYVEVDGTVLYNFIGQCSCSIPISGGDWTNVLNGVLQIASAVGMMVATEGASIPATIGAAGSAASGMVNAMRPNIEKSGAMSGMGGMMGVQTPYLILTRPRQCLPANQNKIEGYPSFITAQLGELSGFTMVHKIELFDIGATREEYAEIEQLLAEGVIL